MSRYIDADALKVDFYDEYETEDDEYAYGYVSKHQIDSAPSIDIVRCRECKHWICNPNTEKWGKCKWISDKQFDVVTNADDYCSYGQKGDENVETD